MTAATGPRDGIAAAKADLRAALSAGRRARSAADRAASAAANVAHLTTALRGAGAVAGYLPLPSEPLTVALLDALVGAGVRVVVPVVVGAAPLDWVTYPAELRPGPLGIAEPLGPRLGPDALRAVDAVLLPALAADVRGHRLGRGGGHYDRSLALLDDVPQRPLRIAVLFDGELIPELPADDLDRRVHAVATPSGGIRPTPPDRRG